MMKSLLLARLLIGGEDEESVRQPAIEPVRSDLAERCNSLADQSTFDLPIPRQIGVEISYVFRPAKQSRRFYNFTIVMTR